MPCIKCPNGKWWYGSGKCQFDTKKACREAEQAIHVKYTEGIREFVKAYKDCTDCIPKAFEQPPQPYLDRKVIEGEFIQGNSFHMLVIDELDS